jgi:hypothetical protein
MADHGMLALGGAVGHGEWIFHAEARGRGGNEENGREEQTRQSLGEARS